MSAIAVPATYLALVDAPAERALVGALVREPGYLRALLDEGCDVGVADMHDPIARQAMVGVRSLEHKGMPIGPAEVVAELEALHGVNTAGAIAVREHLDREQAIRGGAPTPRAMVLGWARRILEIRGKREAAEAADVANTNQRVQLVSEGTCAATYGEAFSAFVGEEPSDDPSEVFEAEGLIVRGEPSLFVGDPKVGKTLVIEDLMLHVAAGRPFWCGLRIYRRARVLLFLREDSVRTTRRRLHQLARGARIDHSELDGFLCIEATSPLYFDDPKLVRRLEARLADFDVCAIDSLSTIHNADENSVERMAPIMNTWRDLALGTRTALPLIHHFRKRGDGAVASGGNVLQRARGSSLIGATTRHAVGIEKGPDEHQLVLSVESNHDASFDPLVLRRRFGTDESGRKYITHERIGSLRDAKVRVESDLLDPITLDVIRAAGFNGIGTAELLAEVIERVRERRGQGVQVAKVDQSARRLEQRGDVARQDKGPWRVAGRCPKGGV